MSCGVDPRCSLDPALLWLWQWHRLTAVAPIRPLAWEPPYALGAALKKTKDKNKQTNKQKKPTHGTLSRIDHTSVLDYKASLNKFKRIKIIRSMFLNYNVIDRQIGR